MTEPYLIAHKVRNQPAFDVAVKIRCPECQGVGGYQVPDFETGKVTDYEGSSCTECDGLGFWWIIPTSGHRAYPYSTMGLFNGIPPAVWRDELPMTLPDWVPDHYPPRSEPTVAKRNLLAELGLSKPVDQVNATPIKRRI